MDDDANWGGEPRFKTTERILPMTPYSFTPGSPLEYRYRIERAEEALQIPVLMANLNALMLLTTGASHTLARQIWLRLCEAVPFIQREAGDPE